VLPRPLPRCASQVLGRGAQGDSNGAAKVLARVAQAVANGAARCASQVPVRGAQAVARGATYFLSQELDRCAKAVARGAATLSQQEKSNSADVQRSRANIAGFICTEARKPSLRCAFGEFGSFAQASRRRWRMLQPLLRRLRLRHITFAWAFCDPGQALGGMPVAMARIAHARPATPPRVSTASFLRGRFDFPNSAPRNLGGGRGGGGDAAHTTFIRSPNFTINLGYELF
jgi:hypothetical protein